MEFRDVGVNVKRDCCTCTFSPGQGGGYLYMRLNTVYLCARCRDRVQAILALRGLGYAPGKRGAVGNERVAGY